MHPFTNLVNAWGNNHASIKGRERSKYKNFKAESSISCLGKCHAMLECSSVRLLWNGYQSCNSEMSISPMTVEYLSVLQLWNVCQSLDSGEFISPITLVCLSIPGLLNISQSCYSWMSATLECQSVPQIKCPSVLQSWNVYQSCTSATLYWLSISPKILECQTVLQS